MKIAVISNGARSLINFRGPLLAEMVRRGCEVLAFAPDHDDYSRDALTAIGVIPVDCSMARAGMQPLQELAVILELRKLLRAYRPDLCFSYFLKPFIYGSIAARLARIPRRYALIAGLGYAFTSADGFNARRWLLRSMITTLARIASAQVQRLMFQNSDDLNEFTARKLVSKDRTVLIGATGLDLDEWTVEPLPGGPVTFILVARLLRDKGINEYVEAAKVVKSSHPDTRFLLVGGVDENPAAIPREDVEHWVSEGIVEWPGHVEVKPWLAQAHVFVLPSYREGVPRSTQEAMALGRPAITTDAPGCRDTVVQGRNGYMVQPRDSQALADAMRNFLDNPNLIARMGKESRLMAEDRFDVNVQNRKLLECMQILPRE